MKETGTVVEIDGNRVVLEIVPQEACSKCCACGASKVRKVTIEKKDVSALNIGDVVDYTIDTAVMMKAYMLLYGVPLTVFVSVVILCHIALENPLLSFLAAIGLTCVTYLFIGRYMKKKETFYPNICKK